MKPLQVGRGKGWAKHILKEYGMTPEDYVRLLKAQKGSCAICGRRNHKPKHRRLDVDHDHATGETRGLLCLQCNAGLGQFGDSVERLQLAVAYLQRYQ